LPVDHILDVVIVMRVFKQVFSRLYVSAALMLQCCVQGHREFPLVIFGMPDCREREFPPRIKKLITFTCILGKTTHFQ